MTERKSPATTTAAQGVSLAASPDLGRLRALIELTDMFRVARGIAELGFAAGQVLGKNLDASRVGFGTIDADSDTLHVDRDWTADGVDTLAGATSLRDYGSFIDSLKDGQLISIADVRLDERTASAATVLERRSARSFVNVPVLEGGRLVAVLFVNCDRTRQWTDGELNLVKEVAERTRTAVERLRSEAALRESQARLADEADALARLNALGSRLWQMDSLTDGLEEILSATTLLLGANMGTIQLFHAEAGVLRIEAHRGFEQDFLDVFREVSADDDGASGRTLKTGERTVIADVEADPTYGRFRATARSAGYRAVQSTPLLRRDGSPLGVLSTHWASPHQPSVSDLRLLDLYARQAADFMERTGLEGALRLSEGRLREMNERLGALVAARSAERDRLWSLSQDMLARADYSGMMSAVSPAWGHVLGWSETELLTRGYATFMHPEDMPPTLGAIERMNATRQPTRFENRIATRDGGWRNIEWTVAPEADGVNFIAIGRDVSSTRAREAELTAAQEALRQSQKMEAMGQLTGGVAHDFNNLLTPIVGVLDMLQRRGVGGQREQRLIAGATQSAERAKTLVQRLLAFARRQPLRPVAVDIAKLIEGMADLVSSTTGPQIKVLVEAAADLPSAKADPNQLEMALLNLAVNARDAMPKGGTLRIGASAETVSIVRPAGPPPGEYIRVSVADTGTGMDSATLARAIEPFFSTKGIGQGTGLGLSMVHGLASQLGGALTIQSQLGRGTDIELWLPQTEAEPELRSTPRDVEIAQTRGTALLVDDEEFVRLSTADMLGDLGYRVIEMASADEALRVIDNGADIDLVVTDHLMPGMSGTDLARAVRNTRPEIAVLIVSGYAEADGIPADLPRLTKPFRKAELAFCIASLKDSNASS